MSVNTVAASAANLVIAAIVIFGAWMMMTGASFSGARDQELADTGLKALKFYTVESNLLVGLGALLLGVFSLCGLSGAWLRAAQLIKYLGTITVVITFLVTAVHLAPHAKHGFWSLYADGNLFFHLIVPVLSVLTLVLLDRPVFPFYTTFIGIIPTLLYAIAYLVNVLAHLENGKVLPKYDWYNFFFAGLNSIWIVLTGMLLLAWLIGLGLWFGCGGSGNIS